MLYKIKELKKLPFRRDLLLLSAKNIIKTIKKEKK
jgi:hypothetical protein